MHSGAEISGTGGKQKSRNKKKAKKVALICLAVLIPAVIGLVCIYAYKNLHADEKELKLTAQAGFEEKQKTLDNGTILNYAEGPDNGPALLLIHGQGMAWQDYIYVLPQLSAYYHVYAVDCHGHGESSHDPTDYTCETMGQDFVSFIETVIGEPCVVSGHSSGGILATWIAANFPESVKGLIIEDSPFFSVEPDEMQNTFVWKDGFEVVHDFLNQHEEANLSVYYFRNSYLWGMFGGLQNVIADSADKYQEKHPGEPIKIWYAPYAMTRVALFFSQYDPLFGESFYTGSWFEGTDQTEIIAGLQCPTVYLKAMTRYGKDGILWAANSDEDAAKVNSLLKDSHMITFVTGHDIHMEKPDDFVKIFIDFIDRIK